MSYNPNEARDQRGRWTGTGMSSIADGGWRSKPLANTENRAAALALHTHLSLPASLRAQAKMTTPSTIDRLGRLIERWNEAADLTDASFRDRYLGSGLSLDAVRHLRAAASVTAGATTNGEVAEAADRLTAVIMAVGAQNWARFLDVAEAKAGLAARLSFSTHDEPDLRRSETTDSAPQRSHSTHAIRTAGSSSQPFVPYEALPKESQKILAGRRLDPETGEVILTTPLGYKIVPAPSGDGMLLVPPSWTPGDARNVVRIQPPGTGSSEQYGYADGYYVVTNNAGATISIYTGKQFPATAPEVHNPIGKILPSLNSVLEP